ncbi:MAG: GMC family oxidoreductase [Proteobacteria bacterium]|nr:GMC family oxidoreductase [Burkholderiales bacterium]
MARKLKEVDAVIIGLGWTGGILAKELSEAGLKVVALERGKMTTTEADFQVPQVRDELRYVQRQEMMQDAARDTLTMRNTAQQEALPVRRLGAFLPGEAVGGSGLHWSGGTWRWTDMEFKARSLYEERYGRKHIPADMMLTDWGISYAEIEPFYDRFEYMAAVSGKAGNLRGKVQPGGNPFEAPRAREYPLPPLKTVLSSELFAGAAKAAGYNPFPRPSANASRAYTNPDGANFGGCQYCGFCQRFGCEANAKASPHMTVVPAAMKSPNFELRTHSWVTKILKDPSAKRVTGVLYTNLLTGEEIEQPAAMVMLCTFTLNNVHMMLLSGIGQPYDPATQAGVIGRNYCYETRTAANLFFEDRHFNPFMSAGGTNIVIDDFNANWSFDRGPHDFVGGYIVSAGNNTNLPIGNRPLPRGTPAWGSAWKQATAKWYGSAMGISSSGGSMPHRSNWLDLDPTYRNVFGQPLLRMTFDFKDNEHKMNAHAAQIVNALAKSMNPTQLNTASGAPQSWTVVPYLSTHNGGGTPMGTNPKQSAVNPFLQSWDAHNLFVMGANVFPHNGAYQPTGLVGALAYRTADVIKRRYIKNPGPLVSA